MNDNLIFNVDLDVLLRSGLSIQQYLFMMFIRSGKNDLMRQYREQFPLLKSDGSELEELIDKGLLKRKVSDPKEKYAFKNFEITQAFTDLIEIKGEDAIEELKVAYPKQTPSGNRKGLQQDAGKWGPKYLSIIKKDRALHNKILLCIEAEKQHRQKKGNSEYWAMLLTYVNNQRWENYMDQINDIRKKEVQFVEDI